MQQKQFKVHVVCSLKYLTFEMDSTYTMKECLHVILNTVLSLTRGLKHRAFTSGNKI